MNDKLIESLRMGKLELDCNYICLTQNATSEPNIYQGPGYIRQGPDGELCFKIYPTGECKERPSNAPVQPGVLLPESEFYSFKASDTHGKEWTCNRVIPDVSASYLGPKPVFVVKGQLYAMTAMEKSHRKSKESLILHYFGEHDIPCNASTEVETKVAGQKTLSSSHYNLAKFISSGRHFLLSREPGELVVECYSESFPENFEQRITESLQFILAKPLRIHVQERVVNGDKTTVVSSVYPTSSVKLKQPINLRTPASYWAWVLFDKYLSFVCSRDDVTWHPCSVHLASVCEASGGSIPGECLALGVAVEGIVKELFRKIASIPGDFRKLVNNLCAHVNGWLKGNKEAESCGLPKRLLDFRGMLLAIRPNDRLSVLEKQGLIEKRHIDAWKEMRNAAAHASQPGTREWQELLDRRDVVIDLMYRLIFHAIGYEGQRTDYATRGWPSGVFPPVKVSEERNGDVMIYRANVFGRDLIWSGPIPSGQWTWESRVPGAENPESKGYAMNHHHALELVYTAASSHKMIDDFRASNQAEG